MLLRKFIAVSLVLTVWVSAPVAGTDTSHLVKELVASYFEEAFDLPRSDIQLRFVHLPDTDLFSTDDYRFLIESSQSSPRLGFQTLWLMVFEKQYLVERLPITVDVSIYLDVTVTAKKLKRGEIITPEKLVKKRQKISRDYENLIRDPELVVGLMTNRVVQEGATLRKSMLREIPDIKKGDEVKVQLVSGDLEVTVDGKVKDDGKIGDKVRVICKTTGKQVSGIIRSPQLVVVQLK